MLLQMEPGDQPTHHGKNPANLDYVCFYMLTDKVDLLTTIDPLIKA